MGSAGHGQLGQPGTLASSWDTRSRARGAGRKDSIAHSWREGPGLPTNGPLISRSHPQNETQGPHPPAREGLKGPLFNHQFFCWPLAAREAPPRLWMKAVLCHVSHEWA